MSGFYDGHMAVEFYKGTWVLRARLAHDLPIHFSPAATQALAEWRERNQANFRRIRPQVIPAQAA